MIVSVVGSCRSCSSVFPGDLFELVPPPLPEPPATKARRPSPARWPEPAWQTGVRKAEAAAAVCGEECSPAQSESAAVYTDPAPPAPWPDVRDELDRRSRQIVQCSWNVVSPPSVQIPGVTCKPNHSAMVQPAIFPRGDGPL